MDDKFYDDFPTEPIGGGNPYWRCKLCRRSVPAINYRIEGHSSRCPYRKFKEANSEKLYPNEQEE